MADKEKLQKYIDLINTVYLICDLENELLSHLHRFRAELSEIRYNGYKEEIFCRIEEEIACLIRGIEIKTEWAKIIQGSLIDYPRGKHYLQN